LIIATNYSVYSYVVYISKDSRKSKGCNLGALAIGSDGFMGAEIE